MPLDATTEADGSRTYATPDGVFPSVTTILRATRDDAGLDAWRDRVGEEEADRVRDEGIARGNFIHLAKEAWAKGEAPQVTGAWLPWWDSLEGIRTDLAPFLPAYAIEATVWHPGLRYAGTLDLAALFRGHHCVIDWKTSSKPKRREYCRDYELQVAAYVVAAQRCIELPAGVVIDSGLVAIAHPQGQAQEICMGPIDVMEAFEEFEERVALFYEMEAA